MSSKSLIFSLNLVFILSISGLVSAQSIPGASLFSGNGIPGAGPYQLIDDYEPSIFFNKFNFYSSYDPTYGHVQYVNQSVAVQNGFVSTTSSNTARISVDTTNKWPRGGPGRPSVRIISDNTYQHGLFILDAVHMPWGCGTWPAYWLLGPNWPFTGELDIIEGVNTQSQNSVSLHSSPNCTVAGSGQTGTLETTNCDTSVNGNSGCGSTLSNTTIPNNYGNGYNINEGGVYATEWTSSYFKIWFFPRGNIPASIANGKPDVSTFGMPAVIHQGSCNIDQHFSNMSIIINIDFCGAWAGQVYSQYGDCPQNTSTNSLNSCVDFVGNTPSYFTNAYWEINSIKVYQMPAGAQPSSSYTTSLSSAIPSATTNSIDHGMGQSTATISSAPYTGPISSLTTSASAATATPPMCPSYNNSLWTDNNAQGYTIGCGLDYNGAGDGLPGNGVYSATSFENCLEICDTTSGCIAVSFVGGNGAGTCYAKSTHGAFFYSGAVNAAIRVNPATSSSSSSAQPSATASGSPTCPGAAASTYTDSQGVSYGIVCYTDYTGNNIGTPITFSSLAACLPACDSMSGCAGVVFNPYYNLCQLKSSFTGTRTGNNSVVAARRNAAVAVISSASSTLAQANSKGYGYGYGYGYGSAEPGYGGAAPGYGNTPQGYGIAPTSTSSSSILSTSKPGTTTSTSTSRSTAAPTTTSSLLITPSSSVVSLSATILSSALSSSVLSTSSTAPVTPSTSSYTPPRAPSSTSVLQALTSMTMPPYSLTAVSLTSLNTSSSSTLILQISSSVIVTSTWSPNQIAGASTASCVTSAAPCPTNSAGFCGQPSQQQRTCADGAGAIYFVSCGIVYAGDIIDTSGIYGRGYGLLGRATEPDVASCQRLCDRNTACVAFNYIGTDCVLLSRVISSVSNANAIGGSLVTVAPSSISTTTSAAALQAYGSTTTTSSPTPVQGYGSTTTTFSSTLVQSTTTSALLTTTSPPSSTASAQITITTSQQTGAVVTFITTLTTSIPPGGVYTTGPSGSYYVYQSAQSASGSASLCFTCSLTPTIVVGSSSPVAQTCSATSYGTTTVFTTSTVTSCGPQPTCPASGYLIIGPSQSYPGQQVVVTTDHSGGSITYTQIPSKTNTPGSVVVTTNYSGGSVAYTQGPSRTNTPGSSILPHGTVSGTGSTNTGELICPGADGVTFSDSMGVQYQVYCDQTFTDATIDTQTQSTLGGCIASCDMYNTKTFYLGTQCFGVSWYADKTVDNCLLKGGTTPASERNCDSCALLYPQSPPNNTSPGSGGYGGASDTGPAGYGTVTYTTVVPGTTALSAYTTTASASTIALYSTIYTNGQTLTTAVGYSTVPATTIVETSTSVAPDHTIVTQREAGPGYYGGGGTGPGYTGSNGGVPSTVYAVSTAVDTYISDGQTIYSTYGVTAAQGIIYLPATTQTQTVTTTSISISLVPTTIVTTLSQGYTTTIVTYVPAQGGGYYSGGGGGGPGQGQGPTKTQTVTTTSVSISVSITLVPTTIVTTVSQGYTTTIATYVPVTYTQNNGGSSGSGGAGGGTVTVTEGNGGATTVYITLTVTQTVLPSSSSSSFTCRTYATNYLNGLHGRAEPSSAPIKRNGAVLEAAMPAPMGRVKKSIFNKEVIMAEMARIPQAGSLVPELDLWFID